MTAVEDLFNCTPSCSACSPGIVWRFPSLVAVSLVIWSIPLATFLFPNILIYSSVFTVPSKFHPLLISSEGMPSIPGHLPVFTAASTSPSVPADCPRFQWRTGWFVVWSRRCLVHCCTCHRSIMPTCTMLVGPTAPSFVNMGLSPLQFSSLVG